MKRILFFTCAFALAASVAFAGDVLKLGSMGPLTGPYAADGNDIKKGALTAIEVIKDDGGLPGFDDITLSPQDTACDPRQAVSAANKLINEEVRAVIGAYCSSATLPASEPLNEEDIIMLTPGSTNEKVTERGLPYMFRVCGRDDDQSKIAIRFMVDYLKGKTIYLVDDKTAYSQGLADNVEKGCPAAGIEVLGHDHVNQGDKDFSAVLTKVKAANPDVFYVSLQNSATGALLVIQARRMGIDAKFLAQDAVYHPQLMSIAKQAAEGMYLTFGYQDTSAPAYKKFLARYKPKYGDPGAYSAYAYDSAMSYLLAVKKAGTTDPEKVREALLSLDYEGASKRIRFKENGDSGSNYIIRVVKDGEFRNFWNPATGELY
ncbi:branched-chain amino acid ABC transporter substrate-binding protein [Pseudodesulfovibrio tunisiensis]|uniref:branched-chain amino acid ABC transporter substrate-binding protein n=1 Tax=Pseudodesulfovibrio tunisiensis TaxID=463192 RepID=UPI001FB486A6|nr:branched-chain amino acid ABC transporter substrate-binding protein [Pseudodesulfovibrio tunisiensis]